MRVRRSGVSVVFALALLSLTAVSLHTQQPTTHALLIGVTAYPNLDKRLQLTGPSNDVALVRDTLMSRFNVNPRQIVSLMEPPGAAKGPTAASLRPTKGNMHREFVRLAKEVRKGDQVMILFAGHGSQQPDDNGDEDDGRDEIFLPADAAKWSGGTGRVPNAITDDEIAGWLADIRKAGAFVWVVFDACQSTSMTRGGELEVQRFVPPEALGIPAMNSKNAGSRGAAGDTDLLGLGRDAGDIAALYAAQTVEPTPEKVLPAGQDEKTGKVHGLFTYTLISALEQASGRFTYRDLVERVIEKYRAMGRSGPTPGFEGAGLDREVLGQKDFTGAARLVLGDRSPEGVQLRAGAIHGLTNGTILRVYAPNARPGPDKPIGYVKLADVRATSALAQPVAYDGVPAPEPGILVPGSSGEVAYYDYEKDVFKVATYWEKNATPAADVSKRIDEALTALSKQTNGRAVRAPSVSEANWLVRVSQSGDVVCAPVSGWRIDPASSAADAAQAPFLIAKADSTDLVGELSRVLTAVGRARNLMNLATAAGGTGDIDIDIDMIRYSSSQDRTGTVVPFENGARTLRLGDQVAFRFKNTGNKMADVTLLYIDADYRVDALYPQRNQETDATVKVGDERRTGRLDVGPPTGPEQIVAIAVESGGFRQDFRALEQPSLKRTIEIARSGAATESTRGIRSRGSLSDSPLDKLLNGAVEGLGATRGIQPHVGNYSLKLVTWQTVAAKAP